MIKELKVNMATLIGSYRIIVWERKEVSLTLSIKGKKYTLRQGENLRLGAEVWELHRLAPTTDKRIAGTLKLIQTLDNVGGDYGYD